MNRFLTSLLFAIFVITSTVVSASAIEVVNSCCCVEVIANTHGAPAIENSCSCYVPAPAHKLPTKTAQIEIKPITYDLQISPLIIWSSNRQDRTKITIDKRRPLHLASNEIYLKKRALLI